MAEEKEATRGKMLVVGASGGIGSAVVREASAAGWECVCADRRSEVVLDLSDADGLEARLERLFAEYGPFDAIVFAAGVCPVVPIGAVSAQSLARTMLVNCGAFVLLVKAYAAHGAGRGYRVAIRRALNIRDVPWNVSTWGAAISYAATLRLCMTAYGAFFCETVTPKSTQCPGEIAKYWRRVCTACIAQPACVASKASQHAAR